MFWDDVDYFGVTQPGGEERRGRCFMFWNLARFNGGKPLLTSLVSGKAARAAETDSTQELQEHVLAVSRPSSSSSSRLLGSRHCNRGHHNTLALAPSSCTSKPNTLDWSRRPQHPRLERAAVGLLHPASPPCINCRAVL